RDGRADAALLVRALHADGEETQYAVRGARLLVAPPAALRAAAAPPAGGRRPARLVDLDSDNRDGRADAALLVRALHADGEETQYAVRGARLLVAPPAALRAA
ncbi:hypothetical protein ACR42A_35960, partial [Burkholderia gladioli]|uniref:hypothetical protein n=1 Tax=Burkholderia gladioli TaxID=28095 RepID=UPI003DA6605E